MSNQSKTQKLYRIFSQKLLTCNNKRRTSVTKDIDKGYVKFMYFSSKPSQVAWQERHQGPVMGALNILVPPAWQVKITTERYIQFEDKKQNTFTFSRCWNQQMFIIKIRWFLIIKNNCIHCHIDQPSKVSFHFQTHVLWQRTGAETWILPSDVE